MEKARHGSWIMLRARRMLFWRHEETKKKVHFATLMDICHLKKCGVGTTSFRSAQDESYPEVTL